MAVSKDQLTRKRATKKVVIENVGEIEIQELSAFDRLSVDALMFNASENAAAAFPAYIVRLVRLSMKTPPIATDAEVGEMDYSVLMQIYHAARELNGMDEDQEKN